jgi:hypothetical protein
MDRAAHLSVIVDLSPVQWHLSAQPGPSNPQPVSLSAFLSQLVTFLNSHIASKPENTLCVLGAFPAKRCAPSSCLVHQPVLAVAFGHRPMHSNTTDGANATGCSTV